MRSTALLLIVALVCCGNEPSGASRAGGKLDASGTTSVQGSARPYASVDLPVAGSGEDPRTQLWIEMGADGQLVVNGDKLTAVDELLPRAKAAMANNPHLRAYISADPKLSHASVMVVIDLLKQAGISRMAFDTSAAPKD